MKDELPVVPTQEPAEPALFSQPEEEMTALARWLKRGMEQGASFWLMVTGVLVALIAAAVLSSAFTAGKADIGEAWMELTLAKTPEDRLKVAEAHPNTPVSYWSKLISAQDEYATGVDDLINPAKKATAGARLDKALKLFQEVVKEAPKDSSQNLCAMFGEARTLEARNELSEAIEKYRLVATRFPNAPEAKQSLALAKALEEPVNVQFYKELYAYKPPTTVGGPGTGLPSLPGMIPGFGSGPGSDLNKPFLNIPPPTPAPPGLDAPPTSPTIPGPILDPPKTETPKGELPADPFGAPK